jgi:hypothetical protein
VGEGNWAKLQATISFICVTIIINAYMCDRLQY